MKLIVGLGNPGEKYERTRHNLGFVVLDNFLKNIESTKNANWEENKKFKSEISQIQIDNKKAILARPLTYMNNSGMGIKTLVDFYKIKPEDVWIVHDELDLPLGTMKIRFAGAGAGHRGVESVISALNTDKFWRFRLGIGFARNKDEVAKHKVKADEFVLNKFSSHESGTVKHLIKRGAKALEHALEEGLEKTMNKFNTK